MRGALNQMVNFQILCMILEIDGPNKWTRARIKRHEMTDKMELGQAIHQMIPWILVVEDYLGNIISSALQKYGLNTYHDLQGW